MSIWHKKHSQPYHVENSLRGIRFAAAHGWDEIDLDLNISKDNIIVNTHWSRPLWKDGFKDPQHKTKKMTFVKSMTWATLSRLYADPGHYKINTLQTALRECKKHHIGARLEPKADKRFEDVETWIPVKKYADKHGVKVKGYSIRNLGGRNAGVRRVKAMKAAGIEARVIR